jgi:hypothetical protein
MIVTRNTFCRKINKTKYTYTARIHSSIQDHYMHHRIVFSWWI